MINRRNFLKAASLAGLAGMFSLKANAGERPLPPARVTVMRRQCFSDLQSSYLDEPETGPCSLMKEGDIFESVAGECPKGMCPKAWNIIQSRLDELARGNETNHDGCGVCRHDCHSEIVSCADGTRPVIFRLELI